MSIDLSKAYAGQIAVFENGVRREILSAKYYEHHVLNGRPFVLLRFEGTNEMTFGVNGNRLSGSIIELIDLIQVQVARLEGEIKGLEFALGCEPYEREQICNKIDELNAQLKALQNENS